MNPAELLRRLMITFVSELQEHLRSFNRDLPALEQAADEESRRELLISLLRTAHSLKGAARAVGIDDIAVVCHRLEETFTTFREGSGSLDEHLFEGAYQAVDMLQRASERLHGEKKNDGGPETPRHARREISRDAAREAVPETVIRLQAQKLDGLVAATADLLVARRRAEERVNELVSLQESAARSAREWRRRTNALPREIRPAFDEGIRGMTSFSRSLSALRASWTSDLRCIDQAASTLESRIAEARMLPFAEACEGLSRVVRDIAVAAAKDVELVLGGTEVTLDRAILERLKDPLIHLVRNAVDHGIELPEDRTAAGKPRRGRIEIAARLNGARVTIAVSDDGRGIDLDAVRRKAIDRNIDVPEDRQELTRLLLLPGFSTAPIVTDVSGRGVGLDVVKSRVEGVHGTLGIAFEPGHGTTFTMDVPLTLTITKGLIVTSGGQPYVILSGSVDQLLRVNAEDLRTMEGRAVVVLDGAPAPVARLSDVLGKPSARTMERSIPRGPLLIVVVRSGDRRAAFIIDAALAEQEIAVNALGKRLAGLRLAAGATLLPSGKVALVLNAGELVGAALAQHHEIAIDIDAMPGREKKRLLVADDSVTTRTLEKSILESAGYAVVTAVDGEEAWRLLQDRGADLVISDVEMPRMDGFALAQAIRSSMRFRDLPIVLVTARENDSDRLRGMEAGATAYLLKSAFDQRTLLETLKQLL